MIGHSYSAWSQYMAVAADPPSLKAVIPTSGDQRSVGVVDPARCADPLRPGPRRRCGASRRAGRRTRTTHEHVCADLWAEHVAGTSDLIATGDRTPYWAERNLRPHIKNTDVAVWRSNGLNYWGEGHWQSYDGEWDLLNPSTTRMILGQWNHETPTSQTDDWYERTIAWFDHYLRGGPRRSSTASWSSRTRPGTGTQPIRGRRRPRR